MVNKFSRLFPHFADSLLHSYSQIFFSNHRLFALILMVVTFFDVFAGICGLTAVLGANGLAYVMGFNRNNIRMGYYGFNALLVGLGLGVYYQPGSEFFLVLFSAILLTLLFTLMMEGVIGKYGLPYLSIPFLFALWMVILASRQYSSLVVSERGLFTMGAMYGEGGVPLLDTYRWITEIPIPEVFKIYFRSLGAIFFQYYLLAGIIIAIGLLIYSRIAFLLSITGFLAAYGYYSIVGASIEQLSYSYIGFNFILTSMAIGGFFLIPSRSSFLWMILLVPVVSIAIVSTNALFSIFQMSVYSLPFNLVVLVFIYSLKFRERFTDQPQLVSVQQYSPERNLYSQYAFHDRFQGRNWIALGIPAWGRWTISQGHNGAFTHKEQWRHAWDLVITNAGNMQYRNEGRYVEDYFCYAKPLIAPAAGVVETIVDGVEDNLPGEVNLEQNWGNTIIIRHAEGLYSKLCHIKPGSFKVKQGDFVQQGDQLGLVGNSGRSPFPHLHYQIQELPYIGSKTLDYPLGHYILLDRESVQLKTISIPREGDLVASVEPNNNLKQALRFVPGQVIYFKITDADQVKIKKVEVCVDIYNHSYLFCVESGAKAYFKSEQGVHYFTHFEGSKKSLVYYLYLSLYKIPLGYIQGIQVTDCFPLHMLEGGALGWLHDFIAPFYRLMSAEYQAVMIKEDDDFARVTHYISSKVFLKTFKKMNQHFQFDVVIDSGRIERIGIQGKFEFIIEELSDKEYALYEDENKG